MTTANKPNPAPKPKEEDKAPDNRNEGEGSRSAAKAYNDATRRFVESGKAPDAARKAEEAMASPEREELIDAEATGKARARH